MPHCQREDSPSLPAISRPRLPWIPASSGCPGSCKTSRMVAAFDFIVSSYAADSAAGSRISPTYYRTPRCCRRWHTRRKQFTRPCAPRTKHCGQHLPRMLSAQPNFSILRRGSPTSDLRPRPSCYRRTRSSASGGPSRRVWITRCRRLRRRVCTSASVRICWSRKACARPWKKASSRGWEMAHPRRSARLATG